MKTKVCTNCGYEKSAKDFYKDRLTSWCKACINVYQILYYQENKEKILGRNRRYYQKKKEKLKKYYREYSKKYYQMKTITRKNS